MKKYLENHAAITAGKIFSLVLLACYAIIFASQPSRAQAGERVSATCTVKERLIVLRIEVSSPGPETMIITQRLPGDTAIVKAEPGYSSYHPSKGKAKWLLKDIRPGVFEVKIELSSMVDPGAVSTVIAYKDPVTGKLKRIRLRP